VHELCNQGKGSREAVRELKIGSEKSRNAKEKLARRTRSRIDQVHLSHIKTVQSDAWRGRLVDRQKEETGNGDVVSGRKKKNLTGKRGPGKVPRT